MEKLLKLLSSRLVIWGVTMLLQIAWFVFLIFYMNSNYTYVGPILQFISVLVVLIIVNNQDNPSYKLAWSILILGAPVLGIAMFFLFGRSAITKRNRKRLDVMHRKAVSHLADDKEVCKKLATRSRGASKQSA